jgi:hypothetical protein
MVAIRCADFWKSKQKDDICTAKLSVVFKCVNRVYGHKVVTEGHKPNFLLMEGKWVITGHLNSSEVNGISEQISESYEQAVAYLLPNRCGMMRRDYSTISATYQTMRITTSTMIAQQNIHVRPCLLSIASVWRSKSRNKSTQDSQNFFILSGIFFFNLDSILTYLRS